MATATMFKLRLQERIFQAEYEITLAANILHVESVRLPDQKGFKSKTRQVSCLCLILKYLIWHFFEYVWTFFYSSSH